MKQIKRIATACLTLLMMISCREEEVVQLAQGPFYLQKIEIHQANSYDGRVLPYSSASGPRLFLRFGPFQGTFPAYRSTRSRQVTELPVTWGFEEDSITMEEEEWYVVLYEFNQNLGEDLLFSQKLSVLDYESPVQLTDTDNKFRIDLYYGPAEAP